MKFNRFIKLIEEKEYKNYNLGGGVVDYPPTIKQEQYLKYKHASYKSIKDLVEKDKVYLGDPDSEGLKEDNIGIVTHIDKSFPDEIRVKYGYGKYSLDYIYDITDYLIVK